MSACVVPMDVFGTVASTIDLVRKIVNYLQAVKSAEENCSKLLSEISALSSLLDILHHHLDGADADGWSDDISKIVKAGIKDALEQCHQALEFIASKLPTTSRSSWWSLRRIQKLKWPFHQGEISIALVKIERLKTLISLAFQRSLLEFIDRTRAELARVGLNVEEMRSTVSALGAGHRAQQLQDTLKWLSPHDFEENHNTAFEKHTAGTGVWFLGHPKFLAWRRGEHRVLWCPGNPGVGKSVMSSLVVHQLREEISEDMAVIFIYLEYTAKYTTVQLIELLLTQLVRRRITGSGMKVLQKHRTGNRPTLKELLAILESEVTTYTRVFVVMDALDEADARVWVPLVTHLRLLPGISILATSRDLGDVAAEFRGDQRLNIMTNQEDVRKYIEGRLSHSTGTLKRLLEENASLHEEILADIMRKADGMFLLARLHMNSVETKSRLKDLRQALTELPGDLTTTYDEAMTRIGDQKKELAYCDLQYALAVDDDMTSIDTHDLYDEAFITSVCVGLVVLRDAEGPPGVDNQHGTVQTVGLVHYTAQEYFLNNHEVLSRLPHPAHLPIVCLRYLFFDIFESDKPLHELMAIPFVDYAVSFWGEHTRVHSDDVAVHNLVMKLLRDPQKVSMLGSHFCNAKNVSAPQLCTHLGLRDYLQFLLDDGFDPNSKDLNGDTAVTEAAIHGQEEIMRLLLGREGINASPKGWNGTTPLTRAVIHGHQGIVELLLARDDIDINWCDHEGRTPIAHAAECGHVSIAKLLLEREDVDVNSQDWFADTPLALAIHGGHEAIVRLLLARDDLGASFKLRDRYGDTHLTIAAGVGHEGIVKLLLDKDAIDVNSRSLAGEVALCDAARRGHEAVVKLLLSQDDIDVNSLAWDGSTPLDCAIMEGSQSVELLRAAGGCTGIELRMETLTVGEQEPNMCD